MSKQLDHLHAVIAGATEGLWDVRHFQGDHGRPTIEVRRDEPSGPYHPIIGFPYSCSDESARAICLLRNIAPELLAVVDAASNVPVYRTIEDEGVHTVAIDDHDRMTEALAALTAAIEKEMGSDE